MKKKLVPVEKAVGLVVPHDLTYIDVDTHYKGPLFKKGHVIKEEDIRLLKKMGKYNIAVMELEDDELHEDDAVTLFAEHIKGSGVYKKAPSEGKINFYAEYNGLFRINPVAVNQVNKIDQWCFSTIFDKTPVEKGDIVAGVRVIPLVVKKHVVEDAISIVKALNAKLEVLPYKRLKVALIATGKELVEGYVKESLEPILDKKLKSYGSCLIGKSIVSDDVFEIKGLILSWLEKADIVFVSGGMSVDPDDNTPKAIAETGALIEVYGTPVLPGAMFMVAYLGKKAIIGLPACAVHSKVTILDLVLPLLLCGIKVTKEYIRSLGYGGLCRNCEVCVFPRCAFGRGSSVIL